MVKKKILWGLTLLAMAVVPQCAFADILGLGEISQFVLKNVEKRGMVVTMFSVGGQKSAGGAIKYGVLHNKAKTETYLAGSVGIETLIGEGKIKGRLHLGAPMNVADVLRRVSRWSYIKDHIDFIKIPDNMELWAGPFVRAPANSDEKWQWKTHTGLFISVGKKFGG